MLSPALQQSPPGIYQTDHGTILILRGKDLHSHVATVSVGDHILYMSASKYLCGALSNGIGK